LAPSESSFHADVTQKKHTDVTQNLYPAIKFSLHPRLQQPMRLMDSFHFVAEYDDHHLARITEIVRNLKK
jgi:hypothetical protein